MIESTIPKVVTCIDIQVSLCTHIHVLCILSYLSPTQGGEGRAASRTTTLFKLLPSVECVSPRQLQTTAQLQGERASTYAWTNSDPCKYHVHVCCHATANCVPMDEVMFRSPPYQRVYQYLRRHIAQMSLDRFSYQPGSMEGSTASYLEIMLR